jgi:hypothetical protein
MRRYEEEKRRAEAQRDSEAEEARRAALLARELEENHRRFKVRCHSIPGIVTLS